MTRLADVERHIGSMKELLEVVSAMRSLAGMRLQEALRALPGVRRYAEAVASAIADTLPSVEGLPERRAGRGRLGLVLCTAEHGFVGGFNERLTAAAADRLASGDRLFVLGSRGVRATEEHGLPAAWTHPMTSRCTAVPPTATRLADELFRQIAAGDLDRVEVVHASYRQGRSASIERRAILPFDLAALALQPPRQPPLRNLPQEVLQEKLVAEYVFALLAEALVDSMASENAARFEAMEAARDNVSHKLQDLAAEAGRARQSEITDELLDLVTGAEAVSSEVTRE